MKYDEALAQHKEPCLCVTAGFLVKQDAKAITIATSIGPNTGTYGGLWTVPRGMVKEVHLLVRKRVKKR